MAAEVLGACDLAAGGTRPPCIKPVAPSARPPTSRPRLPRPRPPPVRLPQSAVEHSTEHCGKPSTSVETFDLATPVGRTGAEVFNLATPPATPLARELGQAVNQLFGTRKCKGSAEKGRPTAKSTTPLLAKRPPEPPLGLATPERDFADGTCSVAASPEGSATRGFHVHDTKRGSPSLTSLSTCSTRAGSRSSSPSPQAQAGFRRFSSEALQEMVAANKALLDEVLQAGIPDLDEDGSEDECHWEIDSPMNVLDQITRCITDRL